jgi:hypothetical protein
MRGQLPGYLYPPQRQSPRRFDSPGRRDDGTNLGLGTPQRPVQTKGVVPTLWACRYPQSSSQHLWPRWADPAPESRFDAQAYDARSQPAVSLRTGARSDPPLQRSPAATGCPPMFLNVAMQLPE